MPRIKHIILSVITAAAFAMHAYAAPGKEKVTFAYDLDFEMNFDNREFYKSDFSESMTIFGARLTPSVGIDVRQGKGVNHKLMAGIDIMKDFGDSLAPKDLLREVTLYYNMEKTFRRSEFTMYAGIFPRKTMEGRWGGAFFSDSLTFYDNNLEGLLLKLRRPKAYFELGADWMGMTGEYRRERFMIFSSGQGRVLPYTHLGYSAYVYHYAGSRKVRGVVDNMLLNPYLTIDLSRPLGIQDFNITAGWIQALQNDRKNIGTYTFPGGGELDIEVRNWNVGVRNRLYIGHDIMPLYNKLDAGGFKYGNENLYLGDPFYRVNDRGEHKVGSYDRLEIFYAPKVGNCVSISIKAVLHFNELKYSGFQQMVGVKFNIQEMINRKR